MRNGSRVLRFGVFEVDLGARELRKRGVRIRLQDQPFRVLQALLEKPGEVVTREQLKDRLWAQDEFVEFDKSLNTAIQKIRQGLGDLAENPRFLETVPRIGYKFVAPVQDSALAEPSAIPSPEKPNAEIPVPPGADGQPHRSRLRTRERLLWGLPAVALVGCSIWLYLKSETIDNRPLRKWSFVASDPAPRLLVQQ